MRGFVECPYSLCQPLRWQLEVPSCQIAGPWCSKWQPRDWSRWNPSFLGRTCQTPSWALQVNREKKLFKWFHQARSYCKLHAGFIIHARFYWIIQRKEVTYSESFHRRLPMKQTSKKEFDQLFYIKRLVQRDFIQGIGHKIKLNVFYGLPLWSYLILVTSGDGGWSDRRCLVDWDGCEMRRCRPKRRPCHADERSQCGAKVLSRVYRLQTRNELWFFLLFAGIHQPFWAGCPTWRGRNLSIYLCIMRRSR